MKKAPRKAAKSLATARKRSKPVSAPRRAKKAMSREARVMYAEIERGVRHLDKSIGEIQRGLRKAERKLEADARTRIRTLRKDARTHLSALKAKQREAAGTLKRVSAAAGSAAGCGRVWARAAEDATDTTRAAAPKARNEARNMGVVSLS